MKRRMWSLALGLVCAGMTLSVAGHAGWMPQKATQVPAMSALDLPAMKKPVSKRFVNAKLGDVLAWLSLEQFSFVADASEFSEGKTVTLSFQKQPLGAVLDAIADAYGGRWERRGDIFTLRPASRNPSLSFGTTAAKVVGPEVAVKSSAPAISASRLLGKTSLSAPAKSYDVIVEPALPGTTARALGTTLTLPKTVDLALAAPRTGALSLQDPKDPKQAEEAMRQAEKAMRAAEEAIKKLHESGELQKAMEKAMQAAHGEHSEAMKKAMEEVRAAMKNLHQSEEWKKAWQEAREGIKQALKSGMVNDDETGKKRPMTPKERATLEKSLKTLEKMPEIKFDEKSLFIPKFEMKELPKMEFKELPKMDPKAFQELKMLDKAEIKKLYKMKGQKGETWVMPKMDPKAFKELEKSGIFKMVPDKEFMQRFKLVPGEGGAFVFGDMDADRAKKIEQKIQEMRKKSGVKGFGGMEGLKGFEPFMKLEAPEMKMRFEELKGPEGGKMFRLGSGGMDLKRLIDSLSAEQKAKHEKDGYLTPEDLTPEQRKMLGDIPKEGSWTFSYSDNGKKITIKNR